MEDFNRQVTDPVSWKKTKRNQALPVYTTMKPGKIVPVAAAVLLREDSAILDLEINCEMMETAELLMNQVHLRATAYLFPWSACERFQQSRDQFDRSYMKQPQVDGGAVVPFFQTVVAGAHGSNAIHKALGIHHKVGDTVNNMYIEAYNAIVNYRRKNRSPKLSKRLLTDTSLAEAFWLHSRFGHIVPDWDQAVMDGQIALNIVNQKMQIKGIGVPDGVWGAAPNVRWSDGTQGTAVLAADMADAYIKGFSASGVVWPDVWAELAQNGVTVSMANLKLAKQTQAFAEIRKQYSGLDDEYIIDMQMDGLHIPDRGLMQPVWLGEETMQFVQAKRNAMDGANLAKSAVSGGTKLGMHVRCPRVETGGIIMVCLEVVPTQLFERQQDPFLYTTDPAKLPQTLPDFLDPEKVEVVTNGQIDTAHATPAGVFGYAPKNWKWSNFGPRVGGDAYRPTTDASTDDVRQNIWAVEDPNPKLGESFYLVKNLHVKPFLNQTLDQFRLSGKGNAVITGNTQFGPALVEAENNYKEVMDRVDQTRIQKVAV